MHRDARAEMQAAARWYSEQQAELQSRFEDNVIDRIGRTPKQFPIVAADFRRALVNVFPYEIFFELLPRRIKILAVAHGSREPFYWIKRR